MNRCTIVLSLCLVAAFSSLANAAALGTSFTYQASLNNAGTPVDGLADMRFSLWTAQAPGGAQIGANIEYSSAAGAMSIPVTAAPVCVSITDVQPVPQPKSSTRSACPANPAMSKRNSVIVPTVSGSTPCVVMNSVWRIASVPGSRMCTARNWRFGSKEIVGCRTACA